MKKIKFLALIVILALVLVIISVSLSLKSKNSSNNQIINVPTQAGEGLGEDVLEGEISMIGNTPFNYLVINTDQGSYFITGKLHEEIALHQEDVLEVRGTIKAIKQTGYGDREIEVESYKVLEY